MHTFAQLESNRDHWIDQNLVHHSTGAEVLADGRNALCPPRFRAGGLAHPRSPRQLIRTELREIYEDSRFQRFAEITENDKVVKLWQIP